MAMIQAAPKIVIPVAKLIKISDMDNLNDVSDVGDIKDVSDMDVIKDVTVYDVDDIKDISDMDVIKDVSDVNDIEDDSTTNILDSRLLTFTREIFKGQISETEYEEANVDFPLIGEIDADAGDRSSEDSKAILNYAEEVRAFCHGFLNDPAMKEHIESVSGDIFDEVFLPIKADNIPPECQEGLAELGPEWCLSRRLRQP
ncbi:hypothetical protein AZE42_08623 [Rhizopogon vesiculosus]|uniref:Uncharacterized protein n=1 Tax=Rhizopogon vesiculosus TaxID=180088 RepID=A0A1J8RHN9_9AGAM|nr:hypothetical protein AZE42_08623 [Rhizopogon vesiculosus]